MKKENNGSQNGLKAYLNTKTLIDVTMKNFITTLSLTFLILLSTVTFAKQFYRFKNSEGNMIVKDQLTNEMIAAGYDVINDQGKIIKRVGPGKTLGEEEQERLKEIERKKKEYEFKLKIKSDAELLRQFSSISDIIRNRDAQLLALEQRIKIQGSKSDLLKLQLEDQQRQAATHERLGQKIPKILQGDIEATQAQIDTNINSIATLEEEKVDVASRFETDIIRYKKLESLRRTIKQESPQNDGSRPVIYDCASIADCQKAWQLAQVYAKDNASGQIEIITNALILTSKPEKETDIALSFSKIPAPNNKSQIVFEVTCNESEQGADLCKSDFVKNVRKNYLKLVESTINS
ncbi:hypothetical protein [Aliikangiella maris]|uniref:Uncharacterized protein n=2 Tax=Aliikangiella maris TaxID=3162458 RepID=A0ABV2BWM6_9GAMM